MRKKILLSFVVLIVLTLVGCVKKPISNDALDDKKVENIAVEKSSISSKSSSSVNLKTTLEIKEENDTKQIILSAIPKDAEIYYTFNEKETDKNNFLKYKNPLKLDDELVILYYSKYGENMENIQKEKLISHIISSISSDMTSSSSSAVFTADKKRTITFMNSIDVKPPIK